MNKVQIPRLEELQSHSDQYSSDPYSLSLKLRKKFREEKKIEKEKQAADDTLKGKYGLPATLTLEAESEESRDQAKEEWIKGRQELEMRENLKKRKLVNVGVVPRLPPALRETSKTTSRSSGASSSSTNAPSAADSLRARILSNTARKSTFGSKPPGLKR